MAKPMKKELQKDLENQSEKDSVAGRQAEQPDSEDVGPGTRAEEAPDRKSVV